MGTAIARRVLMNYSSEQQYGRTAVVTHAVCLWVVVWLRACTMNVYVHYSYDKKVNEDCTETGHYETSFGLLADLIAHALCKIVERNLKVTGGPMETLL